MPRTMESLTATFEESERRRSAGLPIWDHTVKIKHLFADDDDDSDANAQEVGRQIAAILRDSTWFAADQNNGRTVSEVQVVIEGFEEVTTLDEFSAMLDRLYDLADADRTWIA